MPLTDPSASLGAGPGIGIRVAGRRVLSLLPGDGRVRVGLVLHPLDRVVDISAQPAAATTALRATDPRRPTGASAMGGEAAAFDALAEAGRRCGSWTPPAPDALLAGFGGAAYPLLAAAYAGGAAAVATVPRWAEPVVSACSARQGALAAFGPRTTRPVVRGVVTALSAPEGDAPDFAMLALGLLGSHVLEPDCLARVLSAERVPHPAEHLPEPSAMESGRRTVAEWGATRVERVLLDAAARTDGLRLLLDTIRYARQVRGSDPPSLPNRLEDLHDLYRSRVATAPPEPPNEQPPPRPWRVVEPPAPRERHRILAPPALLPPVSAGTRLKVSPAMRALDGRTVEGLTLVVPRTAGDLQRWGRLLANCLGDFAPAAAAGQSTIIGVERADALAFAVELDPTGAVRQFAGKANRRPDDAVRRAVVTAIRAAAVAEPPRQAGGARGR